MAFSSLAGVCRHDYDDGGLLWVSTRARTHERRLSAGAAPRAVIRPGLPGGYDLPLDAVVPTPTPRMIESACAVCTLKPSCSRSSVR